MHAGLILSTVGIICCVDVEEMSDSLVSLLTGSSNDISPAAGDAGNERTSNNNITLSLTEYSSLTSRLAAAELAATQLSEQLQRSLSDLEKMRFLSTFYLCKIVSDAHFGRINEVNFLAMQMVNILMFYNDIQSDCLKAERCYLG